MTMPHFRDSLWSVGCVLAMIKLHTTFEVCMFSVYPTMNV